VLCFALQFATAWWIIIDASVNSDVKGAYHTCGVFGTIAMLM
jgi:hypothetical protein